MNAIGILEIVRAHGAELVVQDGRLLVCGSGDRLPHELRLLLREHKAELLVALGEPASNALEAVLEDLRPHLAPELRGLPNDGLLTLVSWSVVSAWESALRDRRGAIER